MTEYLDVETVLSLHAEAIRRYGGSPGLADRGKLESALAQPKAAFAGEDLHPTLAEKAAAYLFHLCQAHAFVDGNKRVAAYAVGYFLNRNRAILLAPQKELEEVTLRVARGEIGRAEVAAWVGDRTVPLGPTEPG